MKRNKLSRPLAIVIGIFLSVGMMFLGFNVFQGVFTRATDERPEDVVITDVTSSTAKISWTTGIEATGGLVQYGTSPTSLTSFAPADTAKSKDHSVILTLLQPGTTYYFEISYGENNKFDNGGVPWMITTKAEGSDSSANGDETSSVKPALSAVPTDKPAVALSCDVTECAEIKRKLGKGCSTQDYILCIRKNVTPTP
jgi:cytoskeletal protein RodZ